MAKSADQKPKPACDHRRRTRRAPSPVSGGRLSSAGAKIVAHRRDRIISEDVSGILDRQVPDDRTTRAEPIGGPAEAGAA